MLYGTLASILAIVSAAAAVPSLQERAPCGEKPPRICYGKDGGTAQNLTIDDLVYAANYLRYVGQSNVGKPGEFWVMPSAIDCAEWTIDIPDSGSVLALAKHISPRSKSAVLFEDMATTIDGGENATDAQKSAALIGCATNGGQMGVIVNTTDPKYSSDVFKGLGAKAGGVLIKLVKNPDE